MNKKYKALIKIPMSNKFYWKIPSSNRQYWKTIEAPDYATAYNYFKTYCECNCLVFEQLQEDKPFNTLAEHFPQNFVVSK